jgi:hypothetical protein
MLRLSAISVIVFATALPAAAADDSTLSARFAPSFKIAPLPQTEERAPVCSPPPCALQLPTDAWKHDATRRGTGNYLNEDAVVIDRSRRDALAARFTETPPLETKIGDTSCLSTLNLIPGFKGGAMTKVLHCGF